MNKTTNQFFKNYNSLQKIVKQLEMSDYVTPGDPEGSGGHELKNNAAFIALKHIADSVDKCGAAKFDEILQRMAE